MVQVLKKKADITHSKIFKHINKYNKRMCRRILKIFKENILIKKQELRNNKLAELKYK